MALNRKEAVLLIIFIYIISESTIYLKVLDLSRDKLHQRPCQGAHLRAHQVAHEFIQQFYTTIDEKFQPP